MEGDVSAARAIDDPPVGDFPGVGEDGYELHREYSEWSGVVTSGPEREIPIQVEVVFDPRLRQLRNGSSLSLLVISAD